MRPSPALAALAATALSGLAGCADPAAPVDGASTPLGWPADVAPFAPDGPLVDRTAWAAQVSAATPDAPGARAAFLSHREAPGRAERRAPPPGGVGYGYFYQETALAWSAETAIVQAMVVPKTPGGDVTTFLYNTMTNRANLGVEAFVAYLDQRECQFRVFDWAMYPADPWQITIPYASLGNYLGVVASPDGVYRQELLVVNRTTLVAAPADWANEVYLYDRVHHAWDRVYRSDYATATAADNTYEPYDFFGSWGPIFETFQDHDGSNKPIGTNWTLLRQDGVDHALDPMTTDRDNADPDLDPPVFEAVSYGFAVGSTAGEPAVTVLEAEDGAHTLGRALGDGWGVVPADGPGVFVSRTATLNGVDTVASFELAVHQLAAAGVVIGAVEVWDDTAGTLVGSVPVNDTDFVVRDRDVPFRIAFTSVSGHVYRFEASATGVQALVLDRVGIAAI